MIERKRQSSFEKRVVDWKESEQINKSCTNTDLTRDACIEGRNRDDIPLAIVDLNKRCLLGNEMQVDASSAAREAQNCYWMHKFLYRNVSVSDAISLFGSIDEFVHFLKYLFESSRVETFALDLFLDFWMLFPEAAKDQLCLFQHYSCWTQLLMFMDRASHSGKTGKCIWIDGFSILRNQWIADLRALKNKERVSDLALWLTKERQHWDERLEFTRRFSRIAYPKIKQSSKARETLSGHLNVLRRAAKRQMRYPLSVDLSKEQHGRLCHAISPCSLDQLEIQKPEGQTVLRKCLPSFDQCIVDETGLMFSPDGPNQAHNVRQGLSLPTNGRVDQFLYSQSLFRVACDAFLQKPVRSFDHTSSERILYIHQGEVGHATPSQCDVIMSDKATTCHILSIQSTSLSTFIPALTSLAHIDGSFYSESIASIIETHFRHHQSDDNSQKQVKLIIDLVGGFDDDRGSSAEISSWLMKTLSRLSEDYSDLLSMTIRTCAISYMNDDGSKRPIGRGMGVDLRTGEAFLARADTSALAPGMQLRSARIWARGGYGQLSVIHTATSHDLIIQAFDFLPQHRFHGYLRMTDEQMIRQTSTSPDAEESDFCLSVRNTLRFMMKVDSRRVFGPDLGHPVVYRRVASSNVWKRKNILH